MNGDLAPDRHIERRAIVWQQVVTFVVLEDVNGVLEGGSVAALTSDLAAPPLSLRPCIGQVDESAAVPETALNIGDEALRVRLIPRSPHSGGSTMNPRTWLYSRNPRVIRGSNASGPATAAGKLSTINRRGMPSKNPQLASSPAITSSSV